jgi:hypothetical protein
VDKRVLGGLPLLLAGSALVRVVLVARGGQYYFPDEMRFDRSVHLLQLLRAGDLKGSLDLLVSSPDHTGFVVLGVPAALLRGAVPGPPKAHAWAAAAFLALASLAVLLLVHRLARRLGAGEDEAFRATALAAGCTTLALYTRHLVPYDCSMALGLWALELGFGTGPPAALLSGLVASAAFLTYNGYWMLAGVAILLPLVGRTVRGALAHLLLAATGFLIPLLVLEGASLSREEGYLGGLQRFSHTIVQSDMSEGWSLPFAYLWHAEHLVLVALLGLLALAIRRAVGGSLPRRGWLWGGTVLALYLGQAVLSAGLGRFSVYGRLVRQELPFLCLAAAVPLGALPRGRASRGLGAILLVQACFNLATPVSQAFPLEVRNTVLADYGEVSLLTTVVGPTQVPKARRYALLNARYLSPVLGVRPDPPGTVVFRRPHPLEYLPYQYEGFLPLERAVLRSADISMRLIRGQKGGGEGGPSDGSGGSP